MNIVKSTGTFGFFTIISRLLGYLRDILIAIFLGTGMLADAFFVAFRIPNTFRRLFAEGTFNAAFVPSYSSEIIKGKKQSNKFANDIFNLLFLGLLFLTIVIEIFMPAFVSIISPGFEGDSEKMELAINLTRITFPFLFFICLASFFSAILNSHNKFAAAAAAPIILNIVLILVLIFSKSLGDQLVYYLSYGVSLAGFFQLIFLYKYVSKYYSLKFSFKLKASDKVKFFFKKLLPSIFSSGVTQINILIGTIIASFESGAVSYLYYADRVYQINLAIAGIAIGTVALPVLSNKIKSGDQFEINNIQNKSLELSLLLSIPAAFGLLIASIEIINALFGYGSFKEGDILLTAKALYFFGLGIPAFSLVKILSNFFFARDNTKTPFYISIIIVVVNVFISLSFFDSYGFVFIPIATSISAWFAVLMYFILLIKLKYFQSSFDFLKNCLKILISTLVMSVLLNFFLNIFEDKLIYSNNFKSIYLIMIVVVSAATYLFIAKILGVFKIKNFKIN